MLCFFFFQAEDGIRDGTVTGVQTCALPIYLDPRDLVERGDDLLHPEVADDQRLELHGRAEEREELLPVDRERERLLAHDLTGDLVGPAAANPEVGTHRPLSSAILARIWSVDTSLTRNQQVPVRQVRLVRCGIRGVRLRVAPDMAPTNGPNLSSNWTSGWSPGAADPAERSSRGGGGSPTALIEPGTLAILGLRPQILSRATPFLWRVRDSSLRP